MEENSLAPMLTLRGTIELSFTPEGTPLPPLILLRGNESEAEEGGTLLRRIRAQARAL